MYDWNVYEETGPLSDAYEDKKKKKKRGTSEKFLKKANSKLDIFIINLSESIHYLKFLCRSLL
jgi:hypothetical protein